MNAAINPPTTPATLPWPAGTPWSSYAVLHRSGETVAFDEALTSWLVTGHECAAQVLRGSGWSSAPALAAPLPAVGATLGVDVTTLSNLLTFTDPPVHTRLRGAVQPPFGEQRPDTDQAQQGDDARAPADRAPVRADGNTAGIRAWWNKRQVVRHGSTLGKKRPGFGEADEPLAAVVP